MDKKELESVFKSKKQKKDKKGKIIAGFVNATFAEFIEWFDEKEFRKGCHYCGTTTERSFELYQMQRTGKRPDATRGGKRGRRLELDRKEPNQPYDNLENIVWCCYWCNNAKSNFFTVNEFQPIAAAIGNALKKIS
jgi:hypothetical protein